MAAIKHAHHNVPHKYYNSRYVTKKMKRTVRGVDLNATRGAKININNKERIVEIG